jgi:hypothetical protein
MKVKQAMYEGVQWVDPSTSVKELASLMREHDIGAIPMARMTDWWAWSPTGTSSVVVWQRTSTLEKAQRGM